MKPHRPTLAAVLLAVTTLAACGATPPPAEELANELIETAERNGVPLSDGVKACMRTAVDEFRLTEDEANDFKDLSGVFDKADDNQSEALAIVDRFREALEACNTAG